MAERVFLALGSNLGNRRANLEAAVAGLAALPSTRVVGQAAVIETSALLPPDDPRPQPSYLNTVVELETTLEPGPLLAAVKALEVRLGRAASATRWQPRVIDIDVALHGERVLHTPELTVPHPELHRRRFVLEPLAQLAPDVEHPVLRRTIAQLLAALG